MTLRCTRSTVMIWIAAAALTSCSLSSDRSGIVSDTMLSSRFAVSPDSLDSSNRRALLIVGQGYFKMSLLLNAEDKQIGKVPAPDGFMAFDLQGNLYNAPVNSNKVNIIAPPYHEVSSKITYGGNNNEGTVEAIAVDSRNNVLAVAAEANGDGGPGPLSIIFYRLPQQGLSMQAAVPVKCATVQAPNVGEFGGGAFDRAGTLFIQDYTNDGGSGVDTLSGGCKATTLQFNAFPSGYAPTGESILDINDSDEIVFQVGRVNVLTFAHPINGQFGAPIKTTTLNSSERFVFFACLTSDKKYLWATSETELSEYAYPGGGAPILNLPIKNAAFCAPNPPVIP